MRELGSLPEKRTEVLFSRITPVNKKFLQDTSEKKDISESILVDHIVTLFREKNAGIKKKPGRSA